MKMWRVYTVIQVGLVFGVIWTGVQTDPVAYEVEASSVWSDVMKLIEKFTPVSEGVSSDACRVHGRAFLEGVRELQPWAMQMLDASSKFPSGVLGGNIKELGQYDECVEARGQLSAEMAAASPGIESVFSGQYCLANVHLSSESSLSPLHLQVEHLLNTMTFGRRGQELVVNRTVQSTIAAIPSLSLVQWSVCVPSSCSPRDVQLTLDRALGDLAQHAGLHASTQLFPESCSSIPRSGPPDWSAGEIAMIAVLGVLGTLVALASAYHLLRQPSPQDTIIQRTILAFSWPANWSRLFSMGEAPKDSITSLDGIRTFSMLWVILTHEIHFITALPIINMNKIIKNLSVLTNMPTINSTMCVDTFLVLSGLLKAFLNLKEIDRGRFNLALSFIRRYFRLTPAYAVVLGLYSTMLPRLGNGPEWNKYVEYPSEFCRSPENWITSLLYVNNYFNGGKWCARETWYLAADMQLFVFSPLLIFSLWRWPHLGYILMSSVAVASVATPLTTTYVKASLPTLIISQSDAAMNEYVRILYYMTHNRAAPYVIGLALGYLFYKISEGKKPTLRKVTVLGGWALSMMLLMLVTFGPYRMMQLDYQYDLIEATLYGGLHRFAWAVAIAWVIFACHFGYGGWINGFLSARIFQPFGRLCFCMYLTHSLVLKAITGYTHNALYWNQLIFVRGYVGDIGITVVASIFLHLLVEAPVFNLTNIFITTEKSKSSNAATSDSQLCKN